MNEPSDATDVLSRIRVVLVGTTHPGNIGAAARAMKTMGLTKLALVSPEQFPCAEATARASGADDLLAGAMLVDELRDAIADCALVFATSARSRSIPWPVASPAEAAARMVATAGRAQVALVFGREHSGLSNDELALCSAMVQIPTNPDFASLNLAAAVQVLAWELRQAAGAAAPADVLTSAPAAELDRLYEHFIEVMVATEFLYPDKPKQLPRRLRRLLNKASLDEGEVKILRGFLSAVQAGFRRG